MDVPKCAGCKRMVISGEGTLFNGSSWHLGCLRCAICNLKLTSDFNREVYEGKTYCKTHWPKASILVNSTYLDAQSAFIRSGHKVVLYTDARNAKAEVLARTLEAIRLLERMGIAPDDQLCINVGADQARLAWLKTQAPNPLEYPQVYVGDTRVGNLNDLVHAQADGTLSRLIAAARTSGLTLSVSGSDGSSSESDLASSAHEDGAAQAGAASSEPLPLGWVDSWLNGTQWLLSLPYWVIWGTAQPPPPASPVLYKPAPACAAEDVEVECIRTNWYWRHQRRKLRFCASKFYRLDQGSGDVVKDIFDYDDVKELHMVDKQNLTISFRSKRSPEYIRAADAAAIVRLIQDHASRPEEIKVLTAA